MASLRFLRLVALSGGLFVGGCTATAAPQSNQSSHVTLPPGQLYPMYSAEVMDSLASWWSPDTEYAFCITEVALGIPRNGEKDTKDRYVIAKKVVKAHMWSQGPRTVSRRCPAGTVGVGHSHPQSGFCNQFEQDNATQAWEQLRMNYLLYAVQCGPRQHGADVYQRVTFSAGSYRLNASRRDSLVAGVMNGPRIAAPFPMSPQDIPDQSIPHLPEVP